MLRRSTRGKVEHPVSFLYGGATVVEDTFKETWERLAQYRSTFEAPVREQSESYNCVKYAAWTAMGCLLGDVSEPAFVARSKGPKKGMSMEDLYWSDAVIREMSKSGISFRHRRASDGGLGNKAGFLKGQLCGGNCVAVLGLQISMFDDPRTHVRHRGVKREGHTAMIDHSVVCLGWVRVAGEEYFLLWDTQDTADLGYKDTGLSLLPASSLDFHEIVVLKSE